MQLAEESTPPFAVRAERISVTYGDRRALDEFSLDIPSGRVFGLLGPNGSGKSTFITLVAAMEQPPTGTLEVLGGTPIPRFRARTGVVFQENAADPLMTVHETLALSGRLFGMTAGAIRERGNALLARFGLGDRSNDAVSSLSGGMRRRLEMARALLHNPELLLLDEPTTGVDPGERKALWDALIGDSAGRRTILLATNDLAEADAVCEDVAFIRAGRVVATGTPGELKRGLKRESVRITWAHPEQIEDIDLDTLSRLPGAGEAIRDEDDVLVTVDDASAFVPQLFDIAEGNVRAVRVEASSLEDAYFQFVGHRSAS